MSSVEPFRFRAEIVIDLGARGTAVIGVIVSGEVFSGDSLVIEGRESVLPATCVDIDHAPRVLQTHHDGAARIAFRVREWSTDDIGEGDFLVCSPASA